MASAHDRLGVLHHGWVPEQLDLAEVVSCGDELVAVWVREGRAIAVVDVRAVAGGRPASLGGPRARAGVGVPLLVLAGGGDIISNRSD